MEHLSYIMSPGEYDIIPSVSLFASLSEITLSETYFRFFLEEEWLLIWV